MNALVERILDLPPRQRMLVFIGGGVLILFLYAYFFYWPNSARIEGLESTRQSLQSDRDRKLALVANIEQTRRDVTQLDGDLRKAVAQLPDTKEIPDLLSKTSSLGIESGLDVVQFKQRPEVFQDFYAIVPVDILVRGSFHQVASFFDKVRRMDRIVNVNDVSIKTQPNKLDASEITLDTSCAAVTYRFLDEAERERIAKQKEREKGGKP